jgi:hypothetical protein
MVTSRTGENDRLADLRRNYRTAFLRYLPNRSEPAAYQLGRDALTAGVSVLDLVRVHHEVLAGTIATTAPDEVADVIDAAADFLAEVLGTTDMAQRSLHGPE